MYSFRGRHTHRHANVADKTISRNQTRRRWRAPGLKSKKQGIAQAMLVGLMASSVNTLERIPTLADIHALFSVLSAKVGIKSCRITT